MKTDNPHYKLSREDIPWLLATIKNAKQWNVPHIVKLLQDDIEQILKKEEWDKEVIMKPDRVRARDTIMHRMRLKEEHVDYCKRTKESQDDFPRY